MTNNAEKEIVPITYEREHIPVLPRSVIPHHIHDDKLVERLNTIRDQFKFFKIENEPTIYFTGWHEVGEIFRNWPTYSSASKNKETDGYPSTGEVALIPAGFDPPDAKIYKEFLLKKFTEADAAAFEPTARAYARQLVESFCERGEVEYMAEFASKFYGPQLLRFAGIPDEFVDEVQLLEHNTFLTPVTDPDGSLRTAATQELPRLLKAIVKTARAAFQPTSPSSNTVLDYMLRTPISDGRFMSDDEIRATLQILCLGGAHSVKAAVGYAMKVLADRPELRVQMYDGDSIRQSAIEELLRWNGVGFGTTFRTVTKDVSLGGCPLHSGDSVCTVMTAANHDPKGVENPDELRLDRPAVKSLTFAMGIHRCLGINFAKLGVRIALEEWHRFIPDYQLKPGHVLNEQTWAGVGYAELPLVWQ